jgi:cutinase
VFRRFGMAVLVAGSALAGVAAITGPATAGAAPGCGDFHWLGAAGSGQRDGAGLTANGGMGPVVYQSFQQLQAQLAASGQTITAEAVQYPAAPVPLGGGLGGWMGFMDSVKAGTEAAAEQFEAFTERCPTTKVVLAGYSQGAMVIHRNLHDLADDPHVAAALLIADGDRLPTDTTVNLGSTAVVPSVGKGVAQEHSFLASAPTSELPPEMGARTVSVCDVGDPVCDADPDADTDDALSPAALAIHTSYAPASSGAHAWGTPLYQLVANASSSAEAETPLVTGLTAPVR